MMLGMSQRLIDPRTKESTAFYAALGITLWDIAHRGFQPLSAGMLALMAGVGTLGGLGFLNSKINTDVKKKDSKPPEV